MPQVTELVTGRASRAACQAHGLGRAHCVVGFCTGILQADSVLSCPWMTCPALCVHGRSSAPAEYLNLTLTLNLSISAQLGLQGWCLCLVLVGRTVGSCSKTHTDLSPCLQPRTAQGPQVRLSSSHQTGRQIDLRQDNGGLLGQPPHQANQDPTSPLPTFFPFRAITEQSDRITLRCLL